MMDPLNELPLILAAHEAGDLDWGLPEYGREDADADDQWSDPED